VAASSFEPVDRPVGLAAQQAEPDRSNRWGGWSNDAVMLGALLATALSLMDLIRERIAVVAVAA
jgi:hypothetical protein